MRNTPRVWLGAGMPDQLRGVGAMHLKLSEREREGDWLGSPVDNAPPASVLHVTESPSDDTGEEDAYGDEELVQRHQTTSDVGWSRFGHIHRHSHRGEPWGREMAACHWRVGGTEPEH